MLQIDNIEENRQKEIEKNNRNRPKYEFVDEEEFKEVSIVRKKKKKAKEDKKKESESAQPEKEVEKEPKEAEKDAKESKPDDDQAKENKKKKRIHI